MCSRWARPRWDPRASDSVWDMTDQKFDPGAPIAVQMTKWGNHPHWQYDGVYLGADEFGDWLGFPKGTHYARPGYEFDADFVAVSLVPRTDAAHFAGFNGESDRVPPIYIDITTPIEWTGNDGNIVSMIDLDLDIIRRRDGTVYVDDEDEFEEHQVSYGYPPEIITLAEESAERVYAAVAAKTAPYDGTHQRWLDVLASLPR